MSKETIVSSTGNLGIDWRSDDRLYSNARAYVSDRELFLETAERVARVATARNHRRVVFRGIVSQDIVDTITKSPELYPAFETHLPLVEFTEDDSSLVTIARNREGRMIIPESTMIAETAELKEMSKTPLERIKALAENGFFFSDTFGEEDIFQTQSLWGETFGWEKEEIMNLKNRLTAGKQRDPGNKDVWFSGIRNPQGDLVSLAMAERLSRPGESGQIVDIVESTEWRVDTSYQGKSLMPATLGLLHAQVIGDLRQNANAGPMIYAECNFATRADLSGAAAGLQIPWRQHAPQILRQNVAVGDGKELDTPYRDFTFMYLPSSAIAEYYSEKQVQMMKSLITKS